MGLLEGKIALISGVANRWSIATGIARRFHAHGATLAFIYQGERVQREVEKLATELGDAKCYPCDVTSDSALSALAAEVKRDHGRLDALVHSIAYVNKEDLAGLVYTTSRSGFALALDISAFSLIALTNALVDVLADGSSIMALTYLGSTAIVPNYNIAGISKAALEAIVRYLAFDLGRRFAVTRRLAGELAAVLDCLRAHGLARCVRTIGAPTRALRVRVRVGEARISG